MKQKRKKKQKVFRTLLRLVKKGDDETVDVTHTQQQEKRLSRSHADSCSFSAGEFEHIR